MRFPIMHKLTLVPDPSEKDLLILSNNIAQDLMDRGIPVVPPKSFAFFIRNDQGEIIAGVNGCIIYGVIYTDQLWVHPDMRSQGLGKQLMEAVHGLGRECGCSIATVTTLSLQTAQPFYEHLGYQVDFSRPGYSHGSSAIFMHKKLK